MFQELVYVPKICKISLISLVSSSLWLLILSETLLLQNQESEMTKELRVRERLEYEVKHLTSELDTNQTELENLTFQLSQTHRNMSKLEATGKEFKVNL